MMQLGAVVVVGLKYESDSQCQSTLHMMRPCHCCMTLLLWRYMVFSFVLTLLAHQQRGQAGAPCPTIRDTLHKIILYKEGKQRLPIWFLMCH